MIVRLAGFAFEVGPEPQLAAQESAALRRAGERRTAHGATERELGNGVWALEVGESSPRGSGGATPSSVATSAQVTCADDAIRVQHEEFSAGIFPDRRSARVVRQAGDLAGIETVLRVALCSRLPLEAALPLHAAGVEVAGRCIAFLGPSGAGKTTLSGVSPYPVLSDERVVAARTGEDPSPWELTTTGYWGPFGTALAPTGFFPLRALVRLRKGPRLVVERLGPQESFVALLDAITVPASPPLWTRVMPLAARLVAEVPVYEMAWSLSSSPWAGLLDRLRHDEVAAAQ